MRPHDPIEALASPADIGVQARIAAGGQPALCAAPNAILRAVDAFAESILVAALLGELGLVLANVLARAYFQQSFLWADEAARLSLSILAFIGGAVAYRRRDHAFVRVVLNLVSKRGERDRLGGIHRLELERADSDPAAPRGDDRAAAPGRHGLARTLRLGQPARRARQNGLGRRRPLCRTDGGG